MREFTNRDKELIATTPITIDMFDASQFAYSTSKESLDRDIERLESMRFLCGLYRGEMVEGLSSTATEDFERIFKKLVASLPRSYKAVRL